MQDVLYEMTKFIHILLVLLLFSYCNYTFESCQDDVKNIS